MNLTPKNWQTFQHYKDRAPAWIKLHRSILDDYTFHRLPLASKALAPLLWLLASEYEQGTITADFDEIAFRFRMPLADLEKAVKPLIDAGFFVASGVLADCKRDACLEKEREKEGEAEKEVDARSIVADRPARAPSRFDEFWLAYPRRDGPNPRKPAENKFDALVKTGLDPQMMIDAAKKLAADEGARGNIGTRFIPQAVTWLNQNRWTDHAAVSALLSMQSAEFTIEDAVKQWARLGRWPRGLNFGPEPGMSGCLASVELLAKYGLAIDGRKLAAVAA